MLTLPAKIAVAMQGLLPNLMADIMSRVNRHILPDPGGVGTERIKGSQSRGLLPDLVTLLSDRAAARNNELGQAPTAVDR